MLIFSPTLVDRWRFRLAPGVCSGPLTVKFPAKDLHIAVSENCADASLKVKQARITVLDNVCNANTDFGKLRLEGGEGNIKIWWKVAPGVHASFRATVCAKGCE